MLNQTFTQNDDAVFYDAMHVFEASLRGNKAKLSHYLDGVPGCGTSTERRIREQFFRSITLITEKAQRESDPARLCTLLNALLWDYEASDLQVLASAGVFPMLSGENSYAKFNTLYTTWGKESKYFSVENLDEENADIKRYSLSGRLRQCFDFLVMKVYSVVYKSDGAIFNNDSLLTIGVVLIQQINEIIFGKLK